MELTWQNSCLKEECVNFVPQGEILRGVSVESSQSQSNQTNGQYDQGLMEQFLNGNERRPSQSTTASDTSLGILKQILGGMRQNFQTSEHVLPPPPQIVLVSHTDNVYNRASLISDADLREQLHYVEEYEIELDTLEDQLHQKEMLWKQERQKMQEQMRTKCS